MNDVHTTRQVCRPAEKTAEKKPTRHKKMLVTFMQTKDIYLHFTRSNIWANGNNYNFSSRVKIGSFPMLFNGRTLILRFLGPTLELPSMSAYSPYLRCLW